MITQVNTRPSNPHLARALTELDRILAVASLAPLSAKPRADKWSAAEILEHLDKTYNGTARLFEKILENGELRVPAVEHEATSRKADRDRLRPHARRT